MKRCVGGLTAVFVEMKAISEPSQGLYMAVDLGGTNFRVCSVDLHGNGTYSLTQSKIAIPAELMVARTSKPLFAFLATQIDVFLKEHHTEHYASTLQRRNTLSSAEGFRNVETFQMGFTFSFPVRQHGINSGTLIRWTKGFDIPLAVGKDVCALLQAEIDALRLPVKVAALVNDTVGTLLARSYTSPDKSGALLGGILGTGTNGAYVEKLSKIKKLVRQRRKRRSISHGHKNLGMTRADGGVGANGVGGAAFDAREARGDEYDTSTGIMIVNTEWGSFDNGMRTLPNTSYDETLDLKSNNKGVQMFEKRISGMFLGEILRNALLSLMSTAGSALFRGAEVKDGVDIEHGDNNAEEDATTTITTTTVTTISGAKKSTSTTTTTTTTTAPSNTSRSIAHHTTTTHPPNDGTDAMAITGPPAAPSHAPENSVQTLPIPSTSPLLTQYGVDTSLISLARGDTTDDLAYIRQALGTHYAVAEASVADARAVKIIASAIGRRAARLAAVAVAGVVLGTDSAVADTVSEPVAESVAVTESVTDGIAKNKPGNTSDGANDDSDKPGMLDVGLDGSLIEFYPGFEEEMRVALRGMKGVGVANERRIRIGIAKDGSGVGAALAALVAARGPV